jgi:hypothetical protein
MSDHRSVLRRLQARFDAIATGRAGSRGSWEAHVAILDRLAENRRAAESQGWTACALERDGGMERLRMFGIPPGESRRLEIPDPHSSVPHRAAPVRAARDAPAPRPEATPRLETVSNA